MAKRDYPVIIKKYSNRRLYDTQTSSYITLEDVKKMVTQGVEFEVRDAKTNDDLTRQVLAQIIFEQELNGTNQMLPARFLKQMISLYDNKASEIFPYYLEGSMESFITNQEKIVDHFRDIWGSYNPLEQIEAIQRRSVEQMEALQKRNVDMMRQAFTLFSPFDVFQKGQDTPASAEQTKQANEEDA
ncbi:MAG: polyhydroxyalkanoate synthesis repressor PhaR [Alphaproteobacteria bacterium]|nr:MAG: polyhydroxyalkanoate synthesis repressor PhaR [Alphaproteobacteria bacterium]TAE79833.1 MAG: polyhydroxyalkanoate synthesis repressor PhaR [Alphaproteobacteria bacterium]TAF15365.1 MAG: polyhydroxyalkanoate synthesis repressor PhaR [Alphaproteobacteria bacterium]TAF39313.1 MAG: polyhydroxyalkanoate synthesis repressor PhaR [Alphaproteobacteria bacterium]TAF75001.1 MAG: polyhydroxyalkanoate synthesis repressor PhaR [Alphaproteobacteria bacterium]